MLKTWTLYSISLISTFIFFLFYKMWVSWYCLIVLLVLPFLALIVTVIASQTVNFSIVYGVSDFGLSTDLGISFREASDLNLCSCLDNDDLGILARCCNEAQIFSEVINASDLLSLLEGKMTMPLHSRNNRLVAFFFDQLSLYNLIIRNWQNVLARQRCIVSSTGKDTLTQKSLSSALYSIVDLEMSAQEKIIDEAVRPIGQKYQRKRNTDK